MNFQAINQIVRCKRKYVVAYIVRIILVYVHVAA